MSGDEWATLCTSLDIVEDTALALREFEERALGTTEGERYLRLYGFLQAVVLQQDAIEVISKIRLYKFNKPAKNSGWAQLRRAPNLATGHPIDNKEGKRVFVSRPTISAHEFSIVYWESTKAAGGFENFDLSAHSKAYETEAGVYLDRILNVVP